MAIAVAERLITAEEFLLTTDPPGMVTELVRGRIICMPPAKTEHGYFSDRVSDRLKSFFVPLALGVATGEGGYVLSRNPDIVRAPDAAFLAADRVPADWPFTGRYIEGAPTLAVEIVSDSETEQDLVNKIAEYLAAGAERVWEVRPRLRTVTVHRSGAEPKTLRVGDTLTSDDAGFAVDGFALPVAEIFA